MQIPSAILTLVIGMVLALGGLWIGQNINLLPIDASALYARNLVNFLTPMIDAETGNLEIDWSDEIVKGTIVTRDGKIVHPSLVDQED